jgi:hypothetical protein
MMFSVLFRRDGIAPAENGSEVRRALNWRCHALSGMVHGKEISSSPNGETKFAFSRRN